MAKICDSCVRNSGIRAFIADQQTHGRCSFCQKTRKQGHVSKLADVLNFIWKRVEQDFEDPANALPYENREGGYQGAPIFTSRDLFTEHIELDLAPDHHDAFIDALLDARENADWCQRDPFGLSLFEALHGSWDAFCEAVKWKTRFFFNKEGSKRGEDEAPNVGEEEGSELWQPNRLLSVTADLIEQQQLLTVVPAGLQLHRARHRRADEEITGPLGLGPPPPERAIRANRMNPPGIAVFYAAEDEATAIAETIESGSDYSVAVFETRIPITILDLASELTEPDYFEMDSDELQGLRFLRSFSEAIAAPVLRDDRNHVEYVPTQIVAEYFRTVYPRRGVRVHGIRWRSSHGERRQSYVLYATRADLVLEPDDVELLTEAEKRWRDNNQGWLELRAYRQGTLK